MKAKHFIALIGGALATASLSLAALAETFTCPAPNQINCVPAVERIGPWRDNGGQETGNSFGPNDQCANVITLSPGRRRLLCCYQKCGVFYRDVKATTCTKVSESEFDCK
jgi:hypothetical protein